MIHNISRYPLLIAAILTASLAAVSCSDEPTQKGVDEHSVITLGVPRVSLSATERSGRATDDSEIVRELKPGSEFDLYGYCIPYSVTGGNVSDTPDYSGASSMWNTKVDFVHPDVFSAQKVEVTADGCKYSPLKNWYTPGLDGIPETVETKDFRYSFFAFYPSGKFSNLRTGTAPADRGPVNMQYEIPYSGNVTGSIDRTQLKDVMYASRFDHRRADGRVALEFNHLMTGVRFRINNHNKEDLIIENLSLSGQFYRRASVSFPKSGDATVTVAPLATASYTGEFPVITEPLTCPGEAGQSVTLPPGQDPDNVILAGDKDNATTILLLPNTAATPESNDNGSLPYLGSNIKIRMKYRYAGGQSVDLSGDKAIDFKMMGRPVAGRRYTATLNFVGPEQFVLIFTDETDRWEQGSDNDITIK